MPGKPVADEITIERLERALDEVAIAIETAGPKGKVYLPIFERLEREIHERRRIESIEKRVRARGRRLL